MASRLFRASFRALRVRPATMLLKPTLQPRLVQPRLIQPQLFQRAFTVNLPRFNNGEVDSELSHQLEEEAHFEESSDDNEIPEFVKEFLDTNLFEIEDKPGFDKVTLSRNFGSEKISVIFSISDANSIVEEEEFDELEGEEVKIEKENEEETEAVKEQVEEEDDDDESFPVRALVRIEKKGKGDLLLSTIAQDGYLHIQGVRYFKEGQADLEDLSKDIGEQRQDLYMGPVFDELDEDLQVTFSKYLEERGIDTALATFLPDYIDYKEQKEYVNWLKDVNDFVSA